jgi:excinuclease ABC subunit B
MYADNVTDSMEGAISETYRRRGIQAKFNEEHGIVPSTIIKDVREVMHISGREEVKGQSEQIKRMSMAEKQEMVKQLTVEMRAAAKLLEFEHAAWLRDRIAEIVGEGNAPKQPREKSKPRRGKNSR